MLYHKFNTPWGSAQTKKTLERGLHIVSTASHGGVMVSQGFAKKRLSAAAIKYGKEFHGYLCYEEDCLMDIICLELPEVYLYFHSIHDPVVIINRLRRWYPEYLVERGLLVPSEQSAIV